jgi:hypothetical protein
MKKIMRYILTGVNIAFILMIVTLTSGCQPTPERTAVVHGGDLEVEIKGSPAPLGAYDAPESWQETLDMKGSDVSVKINAQISVPDVMAYPVYKVKPISFDAACIEPLVDYFTKGKDVIKYAEPAKADLEKQLIIAQKNYDEEMIAELEEEIKKAPETVEPEVITDWSPDKSPSGSFMADDGEYAGISVSPNRFDYTNGFIQTEYMLLLNNKGAIGDIAISKEDAIASAEDMLHELGLGYITAVSLEKAQRYASFEDAFAQPAETPLSKGYLIKFARNIDGISGIINEGISFNVRDEFAYKAPLYPEEMCVYVDEAGKVQSFNWSYPLVIKEKLTENATLLPFEDVKQRIRDMLTFINSYNSEPIEITSIEMNMAIVDVKDHPEEAMYVPAWFIYYTETFDDPETGGTLQQVNTLALNAIDGGRVLECSVDLSPEIQQAMEKDRQALN